MPPKHNPENLPPTLGRRLSIDAIIGNIVEFEKPKKPVLVLPPYVLVPGSGDVGSSAGPRGGARRSSSYGPGQLERVVESSSPISTMNSSSLRSFPLSPLTTEQQIAEEQQKKFAGNGSPRALDQAYGSKSTSLLAPVSPTRRGSSFAAEEKDKREKMMRKTLGVGSVAFELAPSAEDVKEMGKKRDDLIKNAKNKKADLIDEKKQATQKNIDDQSRTNSRRSRSGRCSPCRRRSCRTPSLAASPPRG